MIKIKKVNKYFNRFRKNQIHVINNTNIELEETGLVALLGPSGCGKTTLLNVIGGLDKVNGGAIYINNKKLTRWSDNAIDNIRNRDIGYIFQDFHLIDDLTVFDNVALALKMVGVTDKKERESRVNYVLKAVGLYRYRNRYTDMLSGGERQRVAIARAIVKDPKIIIADEPTGNLDSRNTLEIMKIIKAISAHKLVILVTHERNLANFYASRILEIRDGVVISDEVNDHQEDLDYRIDQKIYLKDLENNRKVKIGNLVVDYYSDNGEGQDVTIVVKDNNLYIMGKTGQRIENITNHSMVELIDDHYRKITKEDTSDEFDMASAKTKNFRLRYRSIFNIFNMVISGFKKVASYSILRKILLAAFFVTAMFATYSVSSIVGTLTYDDSDFLTKHKDYILLRGELSVDEYLALENDPLVKDIIIGNTNYSFMFYLNTYYQTQNRQLYMECSLTDVGLLDPANLIVGRVPENEYEIVIDKMVIDKMNQYNNVTQQAGLITFDDFLGKAVNNGRLGDFIIVGIVSQKSPSVYLPKSTFVNLVANSDAYFGTMDKYGSSEIYDYHLGKDLVLKKGRWPENDYEVIVNYDYRYEMKLNKTMSYAVNGIKLKVVGYYTSLSGDSAYYVNENTVKYELILNNTEFSIIGYDKEVTFDHLREKKLNVIDTYKDARDRYLESMKQNRESSLYFSGILLVICIIEIYLVIRSSFLARIKEVGVYRAIGMKKFDIYKMFLGEILAITFMTSFTGVAIMSYTLLRTKGIPMIEDMFVINWQVVGVTIAGLLIVNVVFGLLPVFQVIRKKPAAILARSDV